MSGGSTLARRRALSVAASTLVVGAALVLLVWSSRTTTWVGEAARGVDVTIVERERAETPRQQPRQRAPQAGSPQASDAAVDAREAADNAALSNMIACMRPRNQRPTTCPRDPPVDPDDSRTRLPVGGDYYVPPPPDLDRIYTQAERETLVMPSCVRDGAPGAGAGASVCARMGITPPPPTRSMEEVCRDANMGGPCETPLFREEDVVRRRHSQ